MLKQLVILLAAYPFQVTDENTGEVINEGTTVRSLLTQDLTPFEDSNGKGYKPAKSSHDLDFYEKRFKDTPVPGLYEATMTLSVDSKGNAKLKPVDYTFVSPMNEAKPNIKLNAPTKEA